MEKNKSLYYYFCVKFYLPVDSFYLWALSNKYENFADTIFMININTCLINFSDYSLSYC